MDSLSEKDKKEAMIKELIRLKIANRLMDEELKRLQPELAKYDNSSLHPAARPVQTEAVSTMSLTEKTKGIKQETSKLKVMENDLSALNNRVTTVFNDVEEKVTQRDSLFSEIEDATSKMYSLTVGSTQFEDDSGKVQSAKHSEQLATLTSAFHERMKEKLLKQASLQKTKSDLDTTIAITQQKIQELRDRKAEITSKIDVDALAQKKARLEELKEKTAKLKDYLISVAKDEGETLEALTSSITECELLKKKKDELSKQLEEVSAREQKTVTELEEKKKRMEAAHATLDQLAMKKELLNKNHEISLAERKEQIDPLIESLKIKKETAKTKLETVRKRMENREECMILRKELEAMGKVEKLDLSSEMESIKQEIEDTRARTKKTIADSEHYRVAAANCHTEANDMHAIDKRKREEVAKMLYEKDAKANQIENEVIYLKKKLELENAERKDRLAQETRRLLEKAKEDKERREKEERRKLEKEKEKMRKVKEEDDKKNKRAKEEQEKKMKKAKEEQEKKKKEEQEKKKKEEQERKKKEEQEKKNKEEHEKKRKMEELKNRVIDAAQKTDSSAIVSRVNQRRMHMEEAASIPFAPDDGAVMRSSVAHAPLPSALNVRPHKIPKKSMYIFDDDSSEDDDDDMSDFLMDDSTRVMPKVPEKYAGSPPRVEQRGSSINQFELSFADVESSTPIRSKKDPAPVFDLSFNQVDTSTPLASKGSKSNKKQTRPRGKKRAK